MPVTINGTAGITFNDATTQGTAAGAPSSISAVGSVIVAANGTASRLLPGNTVVGSSLWYPTTVTSWNSFGTEEYGPNVFSGTAIFGIQSPTQQVFGSVRSTGSGNPGWQAPAGHTQLSGTWRALTWAGQRGYVYEGAYNSWGAVSQYTLLQRIA
jgi:hypothetical protein